MSIGKSVCSIACTAAVLLGNCAPTQFVYAPVSTTSAEIEGAPAVVYDMPAGGDVRVAMLGIALLRPVDIEDTTLRAIHVRLEIRNRSGEPWSLDSADAHAVLLTGRSRNDIYATSARIRPVPSVDVAAHEQATVDLYFPLPLQLQTERSLPAFDVFWSIRAKQAVTERTSFQRLIISPVDPMVGRFPHER